MQIIRARNYIVVASLAVFFAMLGLLWSLSPLSRTSEDAGIPTRTEDVQESDGLSATAQVRAWLETSSEALAEYDATAFETDEEIEL